MVITQTPTAGAGDKLPAIEATVTSSPPVMDTQTSTPL